MVVGVEGYFDGVRLVVDRKMEPGAVDTSVFLFVDVDMSVALVGLVVCAGGLWIEVEVGGDQVEVVAGFVVFGEFYVEGGRGFCLW